MGSGFSYRAAMAGMTPRHAAALALLGLVINEHLACGFFYDPDDTSPSRSAIISADSEDEAVENAVAQMGVTTRVVFSRIVSREIRTPRLSAQALALE